MPTQSDDHSAVRSRGCRVDTLFVVVGAALALLTATPNAHAQTALTVEQARAIIAPFYRALNAGHDAVSLVHQATHPEWTSCAGNDACKPRDQVAPAIAGFGKAIPDLSWEIKEILVSGNRVIVRGEATGTPAGAFMGAPHSGKRFKIMAIDIHTVENGKLSRAYHVEDWIGAVRQLTAQ